MHPVRAFAIALLTTRALDPRTALAQAGDATSCASSSAARGIDVSYYQGKIDWNAARESGIAFGIVRVSDGLSHIDAEFDENWSGARSAGLVRGAYQYFEPTDDPAAQADLVVEKVGMLGPSDLPVALDVETTSGETPPEIRSGMNLWIDRVTEETGKRPLVYTVAGFWDVAIASDAYGGLPLWVASSDSTCPDLPEGWSDFLIWQRGTGLVPGIATLVDLDAFNGDTLDLLAFARGASKDATDASPAAASDDASGDGANRHGVSNEAGVHGLEGVPSGDAAPMAHAPDPENSVPAECTGAARHDAGAPEPSGVTSRRAPGACSIAAPVSPSAPSRVPALALVFLVFAPRLVDGVSRLSKRRRSPAPGVQPEPEFRYFVPNKRSPASPTPGRM